VVYTAFSAAVVEGLWRRMSIGDLVLVLVLDAVILAVALACTVWTARAMGFSRADEISIVFCGSKKSLASGVPMAGVLFPAATVGPMIVPLMLFHQMQLMVCAVIARRYAAGGQVEAGLKPKTVGEGA
jgi:sodium/bile acid cotransporter 7